MVRRLRAAAEPDPRRSVVWQLGMLADGTPVIFDPAVSVSDAELAMMELFGAPPAGFLAAYRAYGRLHDGYARRRPLYQLYHLLNHVLLFGDGYTVACARGGGDCAAIVRPTLFPPLAPRCP